MQYKIHFKKLPDLRIIRLNTLLSIVQGNGIGNITLDNSGHRCGYCNNISSQIFVPIVFCDP